MALLFLKEDKMSNSEKIEKGLASLDGDFLAAIVQEDAAGYGKLHSYEAKVAFRELARRSGVEEVVSPERE